MPTTSTSPKTFHPFPHLPWELRARIWELTISPRTVHIQVKHRNEREHPLNYRNTLVSLKLVFTCTTPFIPTAALHTCQEARHHLTCPLIPSSSKNGRGSGSGYYEKVYASDLITAAERRSWVWEKENEAQFSTSNPQGSRYIWVNFTVDMIDIGFRRFSLAANYASKIRRVRFKVKMSSGPIRDVLAAAAAAEPEGRGGRYALPNVREAEIDCLSFDSLVECLVWKPVVNLVCGMEDVVCVDPSGERMTLVEVLDLAQTRGRQQSV